MFAGIIFLFEDDVEPLECIDFLGSFGVVPPEGVPQKFIGILFDRNCNLIELVSLITEYLFGSGPSLWRNPCEIAVCDGFWGVHGECSIFCHKKVKYMINLLPLVDQSLKLLQGLLGKKVAFALSTSFAEVLLQLQAQIHVSLSPFLPLNQAQDIFSTCFSMDLDYLLKEKGNELGNFGVGKVELYGFGQDQGFLELQAILVQMLQYKLGLFYIKSLQRYCQKSLKAIDLHFLAAFECKEIRKKLKRLSLMLVGIEEKECNWVLYLKGGTWNCPFAQLQHSGDQFILELKRHPHHLAEEQEAPIKLHLEGCYLLGSFKSPVYHPANSFSLKRRGSTVLIRNLYLLYRIAILKSPQSCNKQMDKFIESIAQENIVAYCLQDVVQQLRLQKSLSEALIECSYYLGQSCQYHTLLVWSVWGFKSCEEMDVGIGDPFLAFGNENKIFFCPILTGLSWLIFYIQIILDYSCRNLYKSRQQPAIVRRGSNSWRQGVSNHCQDNEASPFIRVGLSEILDYILP